MEKNLPTVYFKSSNPTVDGSLTYSSSLAPQFGGVYTDSSASLQINGDMFSGFMTFQISDSISQFSGDRVSITAQMLSGFRQIQVTFELESSGSSAFSGTSIPNDWSLSDFDKVSSITINDPSILGFFTSQLTYFDESPPGNGPIEGGDGNLPIVGDSGDNWLVGTSGDDTIEGLSGIDVIDGGDGVDTAVYNFDKADYTLTIRPSGVTITDRFSLSSEGGDGADVLIDIEVLKFGTGEDLDLTQFGGTTALSGQDFESFIELYIAYFNRAPDAVGLNFWGTAFANGTSLEEMATLFVDQDETLAAYPAGTSNSVFAETVYTNVLGRTPDQDGFDFWVGQLASGSVSRDQFILEVLRGVQPGTPDESYLDTKVDIGAYFAVHKGMSDTDNASAAMALFDGTLASVDKAVAAIDGYYADASNLGGEFLIQVVGVLDDPFAVA
jgi:hypothetical protein